MRNCKSCGTSVCVALIIVMSDVLYSEVFVVYHFEFIVYVFPIWIVESV